MSRLHAARLAAGVRLSKGLTMLPIDPAELRRFGRRASADALTKSCALSGSALRIRLAGCAIPAEGPGRDARFNRSGSTVPFSGPLLDGHRRPHARPAAIRLTLKTLRALRQAGSHSAGVCGGIGLGRILHATGADSGRPVLAANG